MSDTFPPNRRSVLQSIAAIPLVGVTTSCVRQNSVTPIDPNKPLIIAHRGASGYRPEHTLEGFKLAIEMGADYIEPDLVFTQDGFLIVRHDNYLSSTTNVADFPEFAERKKMVDSRHDWFTEDFTLEEIKRLRARQSFPGRSTEFDDRYEIPTFEEVIALARIEGIKSGREIGLYPEVKSPGYYKERGYDYATVLMEVLGRSNMNRSDSPVFIQSFEKPVLREMRSRTPLPLVFLTSYASGFRIDEISEYCDGLGPYKKLLMQNDKTSTGLLEKAHEAGLQVHPWTFRSDQLPDRFTSFREELDVFFAHGVDGVFTDFPDLAVSARTG